MRHLHDRHKRALSCELQGQRKPAASSARDEACGNTLAGSNTSLRPRWAAVLGMTLFPALGGCGRPVPPAPSAQEASGLRTPAPGVREKQAAFLNEIRRADPDARTIDRALINEQNELGLILDRSVELEKIPALMRVMLTKMAAQFPGEDLTVLAYTPSNPPHKVGTARLNARTGDMTYTPE